MKKITTLLYILSCFVIYANGYLVENTTDIFKPISEKGNIYNPQKGSIDFNFFFKAIDQYYSEVEKIDAYGRVYFLNEGDDKMNFISVGGFTDAKHIPNAAEKIRYQIEGKEGNRILKIEWENMHYELDGGKKITMNYQLWCYEMGLFEVHYGANDANMIVETPTVIGFGKTDLKAKKLKYEATLDQGPFAAALTEEFTSLKYVPGRGAKFIFNLEETYDINTLVSYTKNNITNMDLQIEMENEHSLYISIDDEEGNTVYAEEITQASLLVERNLDLDLAQSKKCYLSIETPEKVFITKIYLQ